MDFTYKFPAIKGKQANSEYYVCMIPLGLLARIFHSDMNEVSPEFRAQRRLNEARIPEMKNYILENRNQYVFSALAASVDGQMTFTGIAGDEVGVLEINLDADFLINDGQHRKAAIIAAIEEDPSLKEETIPVVLFKDKGLIRSQQMFTDLNKHAVITSKSLNTLYDSQDELSIITKRVVDEIPFFRNYTDKERDNLGKFSSNIFTLNTFHTANMKLLKGVNGNLESKYTLALNFWRNVTENMIQWNEMARGELCKKDLRENYIVTQGITLIALGKLGNFLIFNPCFVMDETLKGLQKINWLRNNTEDWLGRAIKTNGQINRNEKGIFLTFLQIKRLIGLPISEQELNKEIL